MQVVVAGLGRTGTMSLALALEALGLRTFSQNDLLPDAALLGRVIAMVRGQAAFDPALFDGRDASIGWPLCWLYQQQLEAFPEARCVLNLRDAAGWATSVKRALKILAPIRRLPFPERARSVDALVSLMEEQLGHPGSQERWQQAYLDHVDMVRQAVPAERLLVYEIGSGWEPLCEFLRLPVPDFPFPSGNSSVGGDFKSIITRVVLQGRRLSPQDLLDRSR